MTKTDLSEMLRCGLFRFVAGNVSLGPEGELIVTDGRFLAGVTFQEIDELRHRLAGEAAHIKSLEGLIVDATRERDEARAELKRLKNHFSLEAAASLRAALASAQAHELELLRSMELTKAEKHKQRDERVAHALREYARFMIANKDPGDASGPGRER
jgi:hypothetical protein